MKRGENRTREGDFCSHAQKEGGGTVLASIFKRTRQEGFTLLGIKVCGAGEVGWLVVVS